jgi:quercetin dioxygenase-like cupin family protein
MLTSVDSRTQERLWIVGDTMIFKATGADTAGRLLVLENLSAPGGGPPLHIHRREDETFYVLDGVFEIIRGDERIVARTGDLVHVPPGTPHRFSNIGERASRILIWFSPAGLEGFFREAGTPAPGDSPAPPVDPEEIRRTGLAAPRYGLELV